MQWRKGKAFSLVYSVDEQVSQLLNLAEARVHVRHLGDPLMLPRDVVRDVHAGPAQLELFHHALAPVAELPVLEVVSASHILADLTLIGIFGGFYCVPLYALVQSRTEPEYCSRVIAANNIMNALFMVVSALVSMLLFSAGLTIAQLFLATALFNAVVGALIARGLGLEAGNALLFVVLCASASYIAVPAAMRLAVPEANPSLSLTASLGITFPFNILIGIPLYLALAVPLEERDLGRAFGADYDAYKRDVRWRMVPFVY